MVRLADVHPCPNCASKVVPVSICNTCGEVAVRTDLKEVDRRIECRECKALNLTLFVCNKCGNRFLFEEVAGPAPERFGCPVCGTFVEPSTVSCPACGTEFSKEMGPRVKKRTPRTVRRARGEYTEEDVTNLARIPGVGRERADALGRAGYGSLWRLKRAREEDLVKVPGISPAVARSIHSHLKFILLIPRRKTKEAVLEEECVCPLCGCVTSLFARECRDCGLRFGEEEIDEDVGREVEGEEGKGLLAFYDIRLEESPNDPELWYARALLLLEMDEYREAMRSIDVALTLDPGSRRGVLTRSKILAAIGMEDDAARALRSTLATLIKEGETLVLASEEGLSVPAGMEPLAALGEVECPTCGEPLLPGAQQCSVCGQRIVSTLPPPSLDEKPAFDALTELQKVMEDVAPTEAPPAPTLGREIDEELGLETEPAEKRKEPVVLPEPEPPAEAPPATPAPPETRAPQLDFRRTLRPAPAGPTGGGLVNGRGRVNGLVNGKGLVNGRGRVNGLINGLGLVNGKGRVNGKGLVNGRGRVNGLINGLGLVNGKGLVNGRGRVNGLTNGTGFINGSALSGIRILARPSMARRAVVGGALLMALVVALSILQSSGPPIGRTITVDGSGGDWASLPTYPDRVPASDPNVEITRYGVHLEAGELSFLVDVAGSALGDPAGYDAFYAFLDADGSATTGYQVGGLGADYVVEVLGGSGTVAAARLYSFPPDAEMNWSRRSGVSSVPAAVGGTTLEFSVDTRDLWAFSPTTTTVLLAADDFSGSSVRAITAITATYGAIEIRQVPLAAVVPSGTTTVLRLDISAVGEIPTGESWSVGPFSFTATTGLTLVPSASQVVLTKASPVASVSVSATAAGFAVGAPLKVSLASAPSPRPVTVVGEGLEAYFQAVPPGIRIDGLFADWASLTATDAGPTPAPRGGLDVTEYGGAANASGTFFMLRVAGTMCEGSPAPQRVAPGPPGQGGGGGGSSAPPPRVTGEDLATVYIDANSTDSVGFPLGGIAADYMVEVRGANGRITRQSVYRWQTGWVPAPGLTVDVAKNASALEGSISLDPAGLNGTRMVFETSDWSGQGDTTMVLTTRSADDPGTRGAPAPALEPLDGTDAATAIARPLQDVPDIDGDCSDTVYADAGTFSDTGLQGKVGIQGYYAYICIDVTGDGSDDGASDVGSVYFDTTHNGGSAPKTDDRKLSVASGSTSIASYEGDGSGWVGCTPQDCDGGNQAAGAWRTDHEVYEFKIRFANVWGTDSPSSNQEAGFAVRAYDAFASTYITWGSSDPPSDLAPGTWGHIDIPEFPTVLLPVAGVLVLFALLPLRRRRQRT